ncbi:MAG: hypothetical protein LBC07_00425 [Elusimicrobiota bacterium]|jgi:hypothetical protein|nr:hypothetical protein [Elusimicrobiota bacterium]
MSRREGHLVNYKQKGASIVLTEKYLAHIYKLFFHQFEARLKILIDNDTSPHAVVNAFGAENVKLDLIDSVHDISRYIASFIDRRQKTQINFINQ